MFVSSRLAMNNKLKYLELNGNSLGPAGAEELVKGLASNNTLQKSFGQHESWRAGHFSNTLAKWVNRLWSTELTNFSSLYICILLNFIILLQRNINLSNTVRIIPFLSLEFWLQLCCRAYVTEHRQHISSLFSATCLKLISWLCMVMFALFAFYILLYIPFNSVDSSNSRLKLKVNVFSILFLEPGSNFGLHEAPLLPLKRFEVWCAPFPW